MVPNHVSCELLAPPEVLDALASETSAVDFNRIVPMPDVLDGDVSGQIEDWARIAFGDITLEELRQPTPDPVPAFERGDYGTATKRLRQVNCLRLMIEGPYPKHWNDADFERWMKCLRALHETKHTSWYEWRIEHWGTKWNAYKVKREAPSRVSFQTAWSAPIKILLALCEKFPEAHIRLRWADEDFGNNCGDVTFRDGEFTEADIADGSREAQALAVELCHGGVVPERYERGADGLLRYREEA